MKARYLLPTTHNLSCFPHVKKSYVHLSHRRISQYAIGMVATALFLSSAQAGENDPLSGMPYASELRVKRDENWFQTQIRQFRTYPHLDRAYRLINTERLQEARHELQQFLTIDPNDLQARMIHVTVLHRLKEHKEVIREASIVLKQQPTLPSALMYRGLSYESLGRHDEAYSDYKAVANNPKATPDDKTFASNALADIGLSKGKHAEVLASLDQVSKEKRDFNWHFRRGVTLESLSQFNEAEAAYRAAIQIAPSSSERLKALNASGNLAKKQGNWESARKSYTEALEIDPKNSELMRSLAAVIYKVKDYKEAANWIQKAVELKPNSQDREFLANLMATRKDYRNAIKEYTELTAESNSNDIRFRAYMNLGYTYTNLKQHKEAAEAFRQATLLRRDMTALLALAQASELDGQTRDAIKTLQTILETRPSVETHLRLANLYGKVNDSAGAIRHLESAVRISDSADLHFQLGMLYLKENNRTKATEHLKLAVAPSSKHALKAEQRRKAFYQLGYIYSEANDQESAIDHFRSAIEAGETGARIHEDLAWAYYATERWEPALEQFLLVFKEKRTPTIMLHLGRIYQQLKQKDMAIHYLNLAEADVTGLEKKVQKQLYDDLGYLYAEQADYEKAAKVWEKSLALHADPVITVRLGRIQRLAGNSDAAEKTLSNVSPQHLSTDLKVLRLDELSHIYEKKRDINKAIEVLREANDFQPTAERHYRLGLYHLNFERNRAHAIPEFEAAVLHEPDNKTYGQSLAYAYKEEKSYDAATMVFENVLEKHPKEVAVAKDLAYTYMQTHNNRKADKWFRHAIDARREATVTTAAEKEAQDQDVYAMRKEVNKLNRRFGFSFYDSYRTEKNAATNTASASSGGGVIPAQGGAEVFYQPAELGFRDEKVFQAFARTLWSNDPESLSINRDSLQAGIGVRYKPFKTQNLLVSAERLIKIGNQAQDDWLLRSAYSWGRGLELQPRKPWWYTTQLYGDIGYFTRKGGVTAFYGEARQGVTFNVSDRLLVTPHVSINGRYQTPEKPDISYAEGGAGVSLKYLFNESLYETHRSSAEFLIQYKRKISPHKSAGGWVFTTDVHY